MSAAVSTPKVRFEKTPNPQTFRFSLIGSDMVFAETPIAYNSAAEAQFAPLAKKLFGFPWASGVYVGRDFITVTKQDWVDWDIIAEPLAGLIEEHIESGAPIVSAGASAPVSGKSASAEEGGTARHAANPSDSAAVVLIKRVLDDEIRPMVAQDGGDVVFSKYEDQVVYLHMQGSCAGCPSSTMTLKMGIETRLKDALPEIKEVVSV
ncbi:MAG: NifU family protein [Deltaproteobacteria bacterium]|jgi:Fe-S cluster biogenesis protein NfuA|nr:NifU family protein [Deltaproteobacteria bacterium]